ncbi:MAG: prepilin peptidase [Polyangiaceae bacterium]|jgi:leader peptidase (prepilin peptidase)/N-methyltransferase|nr:prepilin peptidase [Polyangiaceae bacterium]
MPTLADLPPAIARLFAVLLGLVWGSFLNVVIHRVPLGQSIVRPSSRCPHCSAPIFAWHNIPVLSWVMLRGRSRCCATPISPRYVLVEAAGGLHALAVLEATVLALSPATDLLRAGMIFASGLALGLGMIAVAFIDLEHMYIPDSISYGATVLGLATFSLRPPLSFADAALSAVGGCGVVWLIFGVAYRAFRGLTGMGLGDAKLLMAAGAWFGWRGALFVLLAGSVQGTIAAVAMLAAGGKIEVPQAVQREREELLREVAAIEDPRDRARAEEELGQDPVFEPGGGGLGRARIAFGPFLALSIIEYLLVGPLLLEHLGPWLGW